MFVRQSFARQTGKDKLILRQQRRLKRFVDSTHVSIQPFSPRRLSALNPACRYGFSQSTDNPARGLGEEVFEHRQLGLRFGAAEDVGFGFFKRDAAVVDGFIPVSYTHLTLPTTPYV